MSDNGFTETEPRPPQGCQGGFEVNKAKPVSSDQNPQSAGEGNSHALHNRHAGAFIHQQQHRSDGIQGDSDSGGLTGIQPSDGEGNDRWSGLDDEPVGRMGGPLPQCHWRSRVTTLSQHSRRDSHGSEEQME